MLILDELLHYKKSNQNKAFLLGFFAHLVVNFLSACIRAAYKKSSIIVFFHMFFLNLRSPKRPNKKPYQSFGNALFEEKQHGKNRYTRLEQLS